MYLSTLTLLMKLRDYNQADIARMSGVSRQSVSLWFSSGRDFQNIHVRHFIDLGRRLEVSLDDLGAACPVLSDPARTRELYTEFCWDHLYPDLYDFCVAAAHGDPRAVGRFVECRGLYAAAGVLGEHVWKDYPAYEKYINPARRKEAEHIWNLHENLMKP